MEDQEIKKTDFNKTAGKWVESPYMHFVLPASIIIAAIIVSGTLIYTQSNGNINRNAGAAQIGTGDNQGGQPQKAAETKIVPSDHVLGNKNAPVSVVVYSDFQCPFCRVFWKDALPQIKENYVKTGKAKIVFRHFPLTSLHPSAKTAAVASECAAEQGKFWEMHDKIFQEQEKLGQGTVQFTPQDLAKWAGSIGLDTTGFNQCMASGKYDKLISDSIAAGTSLGVSGTPTSFVNGQKLVGAQPFSSFQTVINGLLKK